MRILLSSIYPFAFLLLYLIIPFDEYIRALPNILLGILVIVFPYIVRKDDFKKLVKKPALLFLTFFVFLVANSFFNGRIEEDFYILKKILIGVGLVLLYIPVQNFKVIDKAIIFSALAAMLFSLVNVFLLNDISSFEITNPIDILLVDRLYLGLLSVLSILVSNKSIRPGFHPNNQYYLANIILNVAFIFTIGSKLAIVMLLAVLVVRQFYGPKKKLRLLITLGVVVIASLFVYTSDNSSIKNYFSGAEISKEKRYEEASLHVQFRKIIWNCAYKMGVDEGSNFFGIGFKNTNDKLAECYEQIIADSETKNWFRSNRFNTHNQFLDFYLSTGLVGLVLFVGILLALFLQYRKQFFPVALIVTIVLFGLAENFLHRQIGAYYFGFILIVLLSNNTFLQRSNENSVDT
jgi:O-antigen ligase